jgi:glucose dehydrogenase
MLRGSRDPRGCTGTAIRPIPSHPWTSGGTRRRRRLGPWIILFALTAVGRFQPGDADGLAANVDAARLSAAERDPGNWLTYGRTYSEQRFSPLTRITAENAQKLGLAWYADFDTNRGQEATPLVIDGVLYVSTAWSMVRAFDARCT